MLPRRAKPPPNGPMQTPNIPVADAPSPPDSSAASPAKTQPPKPLPQAPKHPPETSACRSKSVDRSTPQKALFSAGYFANSPTSFFLVASVRDPAFLPPPNFPGLPPACALNFESRQPCADRSRTLQCLAVPAPARCPTGSTPW